MIKNFMAMLVMAAGLGSTTALLALDTVQVKATQVRGNIYMITGKGGNIGLLTGQDGSFLIDDQFAPLTGKILEAVKSVGGDTPRFLINTHFHGDHSGGNENLGSEGTLIMSHHAVRERLENGSFIATFGMKSGPAAKSALPTLTYSDDMHLHINGETVKAIHAPTAHTDGDSFIVFENANVVHAGDIFFNGFFPFIDAAHGGTMRGVIEACDRILSVTDVDSKIIPGHGPLADRDDLQAYRDMLVLAYSRLLELKNKGVSAADAVKQRPLADLQAAWGGGFLKVDKWIEVVYPAVR